MQFQETKIQYLDAEKSLSYQEVLPNDIQMKVFVQMGTEKFIDFQKDIIQDFIADFVSATENDTLELDDIRKIFEESLQILNTKFKQFAEKVRDVERFQLKGFIQMTVDSVFMSSMIGDVTLMIFRDGKMYYSLSNSVDNRTKIDLFSDFIEGELERNDQVMYIGTKVSDILDQHDIVEMEQVLENDDPEETLSSFLEQVFSTRVDKESIGFLVNYLVKGSPITKRGKSRSGKGTGKAGEYMSQLSQKMKESSMGTQIKKRVSFNKNQVIALVLGLVILFMLYAVFSQFMKKENIEDKFQTQSGEYLDLTLEDIQKDIALFQTLDPTSDEKGIKYNEIIQKLDFLKSKGKRVEDVESLRKLIQAEYYQGFNIVYINDMNQFDDTASGRKTRIFNFNTTETAKLGTLTSLQVPKDIMIAGTQGALIGVSSDSSRGTLTEFNLGKTLKECNTSLLKNGLYCYSPEGDIYLVTKGGLETVETSDGDFANPIGGIGTYNKNNFYDFKPDLNNIGSVLLTRYRNVAGSQTQYQNGSVYTVGTTSGADFGTFSSFAIDGTFIARGGNSLYQFWRPDSASTVLSYRSIPMNGGDTVSTTYSTNVKVLTYGNTRYLYLFDRDNQTFTVYDSYSVKTNSANVSNFQLKYLMRFQFDLGTNKVWDIAIPETTGDKPELYILTSQGINKIALYEFIDSIKNNNVLKTVNNGQ